MITNNSCADDLLNDGYVNDVLSKLVSHTDKAWFALRDMDNAAKLIESLRDENARLSASLAASTNYVADDEVFPTKVYFANGRTVKLVQQNGGYLSVDMEKK